EVAVVSLRWPEGVERLLLFIVLAQRLAEFVQRIDAFPRRDQRPLPGDFLHQFVDIFELLQRRPAGIARPPARTRPQPHREGFGEILIRMALRVPEPKMLDILPAGRIGPIVARVMLRGPAEQLLPTPAALQLIAVLYGMACLMAE